MNIGQQNQALPMAPWARQVLDKVQACQDDKECSRQSAHQDVITFSAGEVRKGMIEVLTDEIPGMDEALGEKGKVVFNGVTTNFQQSDGTTEFTQSSKEGELNYGKVNPETGTITYIVMSHKEGQGTYFDALTAGEGAYHGRESEGLRTGGFIAP